MLSKRFIPASIAACSFCAIFAASVFASNVPGKSSALHMTALVAKPEKDRRADQRRVVGNDRKAIQLAKAEKARQAELKAPRRIVTYKLFHDPVFKLDGAIADKRQIITPSRLIAVPGYPVSGNPPPVLVNKSPSAAALKLDESNDADLAFGCRERPFGTPSVKREMSACFAHKLDKSWKTQTYVTKGYTEGTQTWGGGLAFGYHY
jgi:hypothetical protein